MAEFYVKDPNGTMAAALVGYARTSTLEQDAGLEAQQQALADPGWNGSSRSKPLPSAPARSWARHLSLSARATPSWSRSLIGWPGRSRTCGRSFSAYRPRRGLADR